MFFFFVFYQGLDSVAALLLDGLFQGLRSSPNISFVLFCLIVYIYFPQSSGQGGAGKIVSNIKKDYDYLLFLLPPSLFSIFIARTPSIFLFRFFFSTVLIMIYDSFFLSFFCASRESKY